MARKKAAAPVAPAAQAEAEGVVGCSDPAAPYRPDQQKSQAPPAAAAAAPPAPAGPEPPPDEDDAIEIPSFLSIARRAREDAP
jgi:hypothetical protein